ncbi:MAG: metallophosphoesterase [Clostridia bacterium]|nr:metallophosphoesterase [Clostridia bacterium]
MPNNRQTVRRFFPRMDACICVPQNVEPALRHFALSDAPQSLRGIKLAFATDFHLRGHMRPERWMEQIASESPDMLLLGGDLADQRTWAERMIALLGEIHPPLGTYAVPGNNDFEAFGGISSLRAACERVNIRLLVNESVRVDNFTIAGIDEYKHGIPDASGLFHPGDGYRILLSHFPILPALPHTLMPQLVLCGHTHGGQFNLLGLTPYAIGFERFLSGKETAYHHVSGWMAEGSTRILVSKGIGMSRIPLRIGVRPEIHLIEFT